MPKTTTVNVEALQSAITDLGDAVKRASNTVGSDICTAVANIIASVKHGSGVQRELMDAASSAGFTPSYYANSIRVDFEPAVSASGLPLDATGAILAENAVLKRELRLMNLNQNGEQKVNTVISRLLADEARNAELPPGYSWYVRSASGTWYLQERAGWSFGPRDKATPFQTSEAAQAAIVANSLKGVEVKSAPTYKPGA